jgi:hypothetical protein
MLQGLLRASREQRQRACQRQQAVTLAPWPRQAALPGARRQPEQPVLWVQRLRKQLRRPELQGIELPGRQLQEPELPESELQELAPPQQAPREPPGEPDGHLRWKSQPVEGVPGQFQRLQQRTQRQRRGHQQRELAPQAPASLLQGPPLREPLSLRYPPVQLRYRQSRGHRKLPLRRRRAFPPQPFWQQPSSLGPFWQRPSSPGPFWQQPFWLGPSWAQVAARRGSDPRAQPCDAHDQPGAQPHSKSGS